MKKFLLGLVLFLYADVNTYAQKKSPINIRLRVLELNQIGKKFTFKTKDNTKTHLKFLGTLRAENGENYKVLTSIWLWGISHRATSRILIYSANNKYLGDYILTVIDDLPSYIKNNKLVFPNNGIDCDKQVVTYVDFKNGIPKQFFRECTNGSGDVYSFSAN